MPSEGPGTQGAARLSPNEQRVAAICLNYYAGTRGLTGPVATAENLHVFKPGWLRAALEQCLKEDILTGEGESIARAALLRLEGALPAHPWPQLPTYMARRADGTTVRVTVPDSEPEPEPGLLTVRLTAAELAALARGVEPEEHEDAAVRVWARLVEKLAQAARTAQREREHGSAWQRSHGYDPRGPGRG